MADIQFLRLDAAGAWARRDAIAAIHRDAYADRIESGDSFESPEAFMKRFDSHARHPSFDLLIAQVDSEPVGQVWGFPDKPTIASWPGGGVDEGEPIFALCEIMVRQEWTGQGIAHSLHDELLAGRPERFAELYVRPDNTRARCAYFRWGWVKTGQTRPDLSDAPVFDVLVLPLA